MKTLLSPLVLALSCALAQAQTQSDEVKRLRAETKAMRAQIVELRAAKQIEQARAQHAKTLQTLRVLQQNNK